MLERITFVDSDPPPASANAGEPPETATETATAIDWTLIWASFVAVITTSPPTSIAPASLMKAVTDVSTEL